MVAGAGLSELTTKLWLVHMRFKSSKIFYKKRDEQIISFYLNGCGSWIFGAYDETVACPHEVCKRTHGLISIYRWFDFFGKLTR